VLIIVRPQDNRTLPDGEPAPARDTASGNAPGSVFTAYLVVVGSYDEFTVVAAYGSREAAQLVAATHNATFHPHCVTVGCLARVEEISFSLVADNHSITWELFF
jgi:hypothetical protein